jgi:hypothetical protein
MSPTQRSLVLLKKEGWLPAIVEKFNIFAKIRQDLYGCIDIVAIRKGAILGVQTTSGSNVAAHVTKILALPNAKLWMLAGARLEVHGWRKAGKRGERKLWSCRRVEIIEEDFQCTDVE